MFAFFVQPAYSFFMARSFQLVLASTSPYRKMLLEQLQIPFVATAPLYQEERDPKGLLDELVQRLATKKAQSLASCYPEALILGSDQMAEWKGQRFGKPNSEEEAIKQLEKLQGQTHRLRTGVALFDAATGWHAQTLDVHEMTMRALSKHQIETYVYQEQPLDCAGAYKVEGSGIALFESMSGQDFSGIIGLPLTQVVDLLCRYFKTNLENQMLSPDSWIFQP